MYGMSHQAWIFCSCREYIGYVTLEDFNACFPAVDLEEKGTDKKIHYLRFIPRRAAVVNFVRTDFLLMFTTRDWSPWIKRSRLSRYWPVRGVIKSNCSPSLCKTRIKYKEYLFIYCVLWNASLFIGSVNKLTTVLSVI